jgi:hypothetical protein
MRAPTDWRIDFRISRLVKAKNASRGFDPQELASRGMTVRIKRSRCGRLTPNPWLTTPVSTDGERTLFLTQVRSD